MPDLSIIICTHNPRDNYFEKVLNALKAQTLPLERWELLLIDNASTESLCETIDLSWHLNARHIRENQLGLTPARLRGIQEARTETLIFVDDDNVLNPDYLEIALQIDKTWPILGAWGGQTIPAFEEEPPNWTRAYWGYLAIRQFDQDRWSNLLHQNETTPCGAGLCVRKAVAEKYAELVTNDPKRKNLGRKGKRLLSAEDIDLAYVSCDVGLGIGLFTSLKLMHLMPASRLSEEYLLRIVEGSTYSQVILNWLRGQTPPEPSLQSNILLQIRRFLMKPRERRFHDAYYRGFNLALKELPTLSHNI